MADFGVGKAVPRLHFDKADGGFLRDDDVNFAVWAAEISLDQLIAIASEIVEREFFSDNS